MSRGVYLFITISAGLITSFVLVLVWLWPVNNNPAIISTSNLKQLSIGNASLLVEVADEPVEMFRGLSDRVSMPQNQGMMFVFEKSDQHRFWMKGMLFPLDFIWIEDGKVVELSNNILPPSRSNGEVINVYPKVFVDRVIEVNAGWTKANHVKIGDIVPYP